MKLRIRITVSVIACVLARGASAQARPAAPSPIGTWRFTVRGDSLVGEMKRSDGTKYRDVRTARSR